MKETFKRITKGGVGEGGIFIALLFIILIFSILQPAFLTPGNLTNIILQYSYILILAVGMLMVIVLGQIDLSVGAMVALSGATAAVIVIKMDMPWFVGVLAALAIGVLMGAFQGFWVAFMGIPGFIVTLGGMLLFRGLTYLVLNNVSLSPFGGSYYDIANGFLNGLLGGNGYDLFTLLIFAVAVAAFVAQQIRSRKAAISYNQTVAPLPVFIGKLVLIAAVVMWFAWKLANNRGLPIILIILAIIVMVYGSVTKSTTFGRDIYAIGGNKEAARLSGINVRRVTFWVYVNMGFLAAVAGVAFSARMNGAQPAAGNMFELDAIAACFIGGASTTGGTGRVVGAIVGGLVMAVLSNGMQLMGASSSQQQIVKGLVLLIAVAFDVYNKRRAQVA